ncbi:MAG: 4a-hydroxytetrahydrobiopterin dehydratase [Candidatus Marinimicrobia bacterium]|nr:4a-hydroxytetrahydrobiopterin dehydratase [Candidatus Neomarinimicrobiota bacterium]
MKLLDHPGWEYNGSEITKCFEFTHYMDGIDFVQKIAAEAESNNHHPDICVGWCKVEVSFSTHDANGITDLDFNMALIADQLIQP